MHRWLLLSEESLEAARERLDGLNVFPIPDSDTGTNMLATMRACRRAVEEEAAEQQDREDLGALLAAAGTRAMSEAHGNSGTLLAVLISGFAEPLHTVPRLSAAGLADALERGGLRAWSALSEPVSGTMLSVVDALAARARRLAAEAEEPDSRAAVQGAADALVDVARTAVESTVEQLEALRRERVVDAGAAGLLLVVEALRAAVTGTAVRDEIIDGLLGLDGRRPTTDAPATAAEPAATSAAGVEIMCTSRLDPLGAASLRHRLDELGEAVIITPIDVEPDAAGTHRWRIHVHTADAREVEEALRAAGSVETLDVTALSTGTEGVSTEDGGEH